MPLDLQRAIRGRTIAEQSTRGRRGKTLLLSVQLKEGTDGERVKIAAHTRASVASCPIWQAPQIAPPLPHEGFIEPAGRFDR